MSRKQVYLDSASTSFPKPASMWDAMQRYASEIGVSPDRAGSARQREACALIEGTRARLADLICAPRLEAVSFCSGATMALNTVLRGSLKPGDHVVTTCAEHNSILRPLESLQRNGVITYDVISVAADGTVDLDALATVITQRTRLVAVTHASNATGAILPVQEIGAIVAREGKELLVDCSQSIGGVPIDVDAWNASYVAFSAHKSLLGPSGLGAPSSSGIPILSSHSAKAARATTHTR